MPAKAECRRLTLVLLLSFAIAARGAQSVENCPASCTVYCSSDSSFHSSSGFDQADDTYNPYLARIGKELLDPPDEAADWNTLPAGARSLPGVPAAIFMVLTGFLCVSFVNDRRIWLATLAGLLWLGQTGLSAIPQVASHLAGKNNVTQNHPHNFVGVGKARYRLRSDVEGTQYIGLLHHLAGIPSTVLSSIPASISSLRTWRSNRHVAGSAYSARPEFAIAQAPSDISNSTVCSARVAEHFVLFSPAFAFSNLARGPPQCL